MQAAPFLSLRDLSYRYGERLALDHFTLDVSQSEIFGLLGPNGGGKTTLFKLLTTLRPLQTGEASLNGTSYRSNLRLLREMIGTVFQNPGLDKKLKVRENLFHQGRLYAIPVPRLNSRIDHLLEQFGLADRAKDNVGDLSGGLQRRVEIAKALLHEPKILIMDEPTTGLDPGIRLELWDYFEKLRQQEGLTLLLTTHLLEEAERCDRIAILDQGKMLVQGSPGELCQSLGGQVLNVQTDDLAAAESEIASALGIPPIKIGTGLRLRIPEQTDKRKASSLATRLLENSSVTAVTLSRPSLADLYLEKTGNTWSRNGT